MPGTWIVTSNEVIGWQAKFYETKLTDHKKDIIKLIKGSKNDYPNITKIIFYTNKNWGQGKKHPGVKAGQKRWAGFCRSRYKLLLEKGSSFVQ